MFIGPFHPVIFLHPPPAGLQLILKDPAIFRSQTRSGLAWYESPLLRELKLPHGFTTRQGGVSSGPFTSLNLDRLHAGSAIRPGAATDLPEHLRENYRRVQAAMGCQNWPVAWTRQVHGSSVWEQTDALVAPVTDPAQAPAADALITRHPGILLSIRVADCVPILLADRHRRAVAAIHAGWRGITGCVIAATVAALQQRHGIAPHDLVAAIGPCIGVAQFEVGPEVAAEFEQRGLGLVVHRFGGPKPHIDLSGAAAYQVGKAGLREDSVNSLSLCTQARADEFFSHRRDQGVTGRMAALIGLPA